MTKDELLRLAAKRKIPVKNSLLKNEIMLLLKREMEKVGKTIGPKKLESKPKRGSVKKSPPKNGGAIAKPVKKTEKSANASKPKTIKATANAKTKGVSKKTTPFLKSKPDPVKAKSTTRSSKMVSTRKKEKPVSRKNPVASKKPVSAPSSPVPAGIEDNKGADMQALHPKFALEDSAQEAKFIIGKPGIRDESYAEAFQELPQNYGDNKIVLLVRDPYWCFLYWELQSEKIEDGLRRLNHSQSEVRYILRIHSPSTEGTYFDVDVDFRDGNHYIQLSPPGASFYSEIGLLDQDGNFAALAVSNTATLPLDGPSEIIDEQWMTTSENFEEIYALSGGRMAGDRTEEGLSLGGSEELQRTRSEQQRRMTMDFSSPSVSSFGSEETRIPTAKSFNYWLNAELILFGGADPGSTIKLSGKNLELRPDGTFTARFSLPEGTLTLPVTFVSPDQSEVHTVTPNINRKTVAKTGEVEQ